MICIPLLTFTISLKVFSPSVSFPAVWRFFLKCAMFTAKIRPWTVWNSEMKKKWQCKSILAELQAYKRNPMVKKNLVMTSAYDRTLTVQTLGEGEGVRSQPTGGGVCYSWGEIFCISSTPLDSAVNYMGARTFREKKRVFLSTKFKCLH